MEDIEKRLAFCHEAPYEPSRPVFESASGVRLKDSRGRSYVDGISGIFVVSFGYSCAPIIESMQKQLASFPFSPPLHGMNGRAVELTEEIAALAGPPFDCVKLVNGGSEAVEAALRVTRLYHSSRGRPLKTKILSHFNGYHGSTYGAMSATHRHDLNVFGPRLPGFLGFFAPDVDSLPYGSDPEACADMCATMLERLIEAEGPDSIGAILVEPIIHLLGMVAPPKRYFARLREICDRHDLLLIFDEIVTGFGRTGNVFAAHGHGVSPDIICMGKSLSGGYAPLAAIVMSEKVSKILRDPRTGLAALAPSHTYAGNPVAAAAGLASTRLLREPGTLERIRALSKHTEARLREAVGERAAVRGAGLLWGAKFTPPPGMTKNDFVAARIGRHVLKECMARGAVVRGEWDWIALAPAYVSSEADIDEITAAIRESVDSFYRMGRSA